MNLDKASHPVDGDNATAYRRCNRYPPAGGTAVTEKGDRARTVAVVQVGRHLGIDRHSFGQRCHEIADPPAAGSAENGKRNRPPAQYRVGSRFAKGSCQLAGVMVQSERCKTGRNCGQRQPDHESHNGENNEKLDQCESTLTPNATGRSRSPAKA